MGGLTEKCRAEATKAFRAAKARAAGSPAARDLAAVTALLRRGLTSSQVRDVWIRIEPAMAVAVAYMRTIIARAREALRRERKPPAPRSPDLRM